MRGPSIHPSRTHVLLSQGSDHGGLETGPAQQGIAQRSTAQNGTAQFSVAAQLVTAQLRAPGVTLLYMLPRHKEQPHSCTAHMVASTALVPTNRWAYLWNISCIFQALQQACCQGPRGDILCCRTWCHQHVCKAQTSEICVCTLMLLASQLNF